MITMGSKNKIKFASAVLPVGTDFVNLAEERVNNVTVSVLPQSGSSVVVNFSTSPPDVVNNTPANIAWQAWALGTITSASTQKSDTHTGILTAIQFVVSGAPATIEVTA